MNHDTLKIWLQKSCQKRNDKLINILVKEGYFRSKNFIQKNVVFGNLIFKKIFFVTLFVGLHFGKL